MYIINPPDDGWLVTSRNTLPGVVGNHKGGKLMYPYHNRIKQRIKAGELAGHYYTDSYPRIGSALVLVFNTMPHLRPIRPHKWAEYENLLKGGDANAS